MTHEQHDRPPAKHPAKFNTPIAQSIQRMLVTSVAIFRAEGNVAPYTVLDPFAGIGTIHNIVHGINTTHPWANMRSTGVEIEHEWATQSPTWSESETVCCDVFDYNPTHKFHAIVTSPTYGNRMADHHEARDGSKRMTYRHQLGRPLTTGNSGQMQWGSQYRKFHLRAWLHARQLLHPGGLLILNIKDHPRRSVMQGVPRWHIETLTGLGFEFEEYDTIPVNGMGFGQHQHNGAKATEEYVCALRAPTGGLRPPPTPPEVTAAAQGQVAPLSRVDV